MKTHVLLPTSIIVSLILLGAMKMRKVEVDKEEKLKKFRDIRLRVTLDVLDEYEKQTKETQIYVDEKQKEYNQRKEIFDELNMRALQVKSDLDACLGVQKAYMDEMATAETELTYQRARYAEEETTWRREAAQLEQQLAGHSLVCDFLRPDSEPVRHLCGSVKIAQAGKQEQPAPGNAGNAENPETEEKENVPPPPPQLRPRQGKPVAPKPKVANAAEEPKEMVNKVR